MRALESKPHANLRGERNADSSAWPKKVAQPAGRNSQLAEPRNWRRGGARRVGANVSHIAGCRLRRRNRQRRDVGHKVRAGIVAVENIEKFDERRNVPVFVKLERPADA